MRAPAGSVAAIIPSSFPLRPGKCVSGHGRWQTRNGPPSPPRCLRHTQRGATQPQTHTLANNSAEKEQMREVFLFFSRDIASLGLCSPCAFMSCHLVKKSLYGLSRPHGCECGGLDCGSFRTPPWPALSASDKRASPELRRTPSPGFLSNPSCDLTRLSSLQIL